MSDRAAPPPGDWVGTILGSLGLDETAKNVVLGILSSKENEISSKENEISSKDKVISLLERRVADLEEENVRAMAEKVAIAVERILLEMCVRSYIRLKGLPETITIAAAYSQMVHEYLLENDPEESASARGKVAQWRLNAEAREIFGSFISMPGFEGIREKDFVSVLKNAWGQASKSRHMLSDQNHGLFIGTGDVDLRVALGTVLTICQRRNHNFDEVRVLNATGKVVCAIQGGLHTKM